MSTRPSLPSLNSSSINDRSLPPLSALLNSTPLPPHNSQRSESFQGLPITTTTTTGLSPRGSSVSKSTPVSPIHKPSDLLPAVSTSHVRLPSLSKSFENLPAAPQLPLPTTLSVPSLNYHPQSVSSSDHLLQAPQQMMTPVKLAGPQARSPTSAEKRSYAFISHSPSTYPTQEPAIDNHQLARRKRRRTSPAELSILQAEFEIGTTPNKTRRLEIAAKVNMTEKAVQIWFQNRRQTIRKQTSSEKEVHHLEPIFMQHQQIQQVQIQHLEQYPSAQPESHGIPLRAVFEQRDNDSWTAETNEQEHLSTAVTSSSSLLVTPAKTPKQANEFTTPSSILKFRFSQEQSTTSNKILTPISEKATTRSTNHIQSLPPKSSFKIIQHPQSSPLENQENRSSPLKYRESSTAAIKSELNDSPTRIPLRELHKTPAQNASAATGLNVQEGDGECVANLLHLRNWK